MDQKQAMEKEKLNKMRFALGKKKNVISNGNLGLFDAIHTAWANHWKLRTCPDDWWQPVIRRIAKMIFDVTDKMPEGKVKKLFVGDQEGKKELIVEVGDFVLETVDFEYVFKKFAEKIEENVLVPEFRKAVEADFSTSGFDHVVGSQITMMSATQNFFEFVLMLCGCGIKGVEMLGNLEDWQRLRTKLAAVQKILEPAREELELMGYSDWMAHVDDVFMNLEGTFQKKASALKWWPRILVDSSMKVWGPSGMSKETVKAYDGWLIKFLTGSAKLQASKLTTEMKGLSTVPMKLVDLPRGLEDESILVAGILGFTVVDEGDGKDLPPVVQANHGWSLQLTPDSPFRSKKTADPGLP